jgi:hypothetical protein
LEHFGYWRLPKKLKIELPYYPAITVLRVYPKECKSGYKKDTYTPMFIAMLFTRKGFKRRDFILI